MKRDYPENELFLRRLLLTRGIFVEKMITVVDWSESRVIRMEGSLRGEPVVRYLKRCPRGAEPESTIYGFASLQRDFPAPAAVLLTAGEEEWLLIKEARGTLLADIGEPHATSAYLTAAGRLARFHSMAAEAGWPESLSGLEAVKKKIETLPGLVFNGIVESTGQGQTEGVSRSLLCRAKEATSREWQGLCADFLGYPESLIHGDCHYGNLFLTDCGAISMIDWCQAALAPGLMDLAALVDVSQRMQAPVAPETDMLAAYFSELTQLEREPYGAPERAWAVCRCVRAFLELQWFVDTWKDYHRRANRELSILCSYLGG